jgi:outer membrane immunogenic protein
MKNILLGSIALGLASASAFAADLPSRTAPAALAPVPVFTWSGFYVGASAGALGLSTSEKGFYTYAAGDDGYDVKGNGGGALVGASVGYNHQMGNIVLGVEADFSAGFGGVNATQIQSYGYAVGAINSITSSIRTLGTVRGRLGVAFDRTLVYATGGYAFASFNQTFSSDSDPQFEDFGNVNRSGWVVGAGIEHALTSNLSLKIEGLYADFGTKKYKEVSGSTYAEYMHFTDKAVIGRVGLNYRFGGSAAPVVARY